MADIARFTVLAFVPTWVLHGALALSGRPLSFESGLVMALYLPGLVMPSLAAFALEARRDGRAGVRELAGGAEPRRASPGRAVAAMAAAPLLVAIASAAGRAGASVTFHPLLTLGQVWVVAGEEFGWRGWLWPRLVARFGADRGTAAVTVMWGLWHAPMFAVAGSPQADDGVIAFALAIAAWGTIHGVLQLGRPSVLIAMLFHACANITVSSVVLDDRRYLLAVHAMAALVALAWLRSHRRARLESPPRLSA